MGLDFTNIADRHGAAVYLLTDGSSYSERQLIKYAEEIKQRTNNLSQVILIDPLRGDGVRVKEFYGLTSFPAALIIMDDDTIARSWIGQLPAAQEVTYALSQISGTMRGS